MRVKTAEIHQLRLYNWRRWQAGHRPHPTHSNKDGPAFGVLGRGVLLLMVAAFVYLHTNARVSELDAETLRNGHEAYGLTEKRLGET